jgi:hypothetical protein
MCIEVHGLRDVLESDLAAAASLLPRKAAAALRQGTPLWVNASITYGHEAMPEVVKTHASLSRVRLGRLPSVTTSLL